MHKKFNIYTGYVKFESGDKTAEISSNDFFDIWYENTIKYNKNYEYTINVVGPHKPESSKNFNILSQYDNLGHIGEYLNGSKKGRWCGWTTGIIYGMIDAYAKNADFVYKEQDCLAFGDYINVMYEQIGEKGVIFGKNLLMGVAQSLFLVKREMIPDFIGHLSLGDDKDTLPEFKFKKYNNHTIFSFGYDRDRPFKNDEVFYIQQIKKIDMEKLEKYGL